mmetsp:Transcript_23564/g.65533  ORF Transcript_23564/g.65533 Transcript_23564/m.65533 type:complete len:209 (-) Transcript_23564:308-934(-)
MHRATWARRPVFVPATPLPSGPPQAAWHRAPRRCRHSVLEASTARRSKTVRNHNACASKSGATLDEATARPVFHAARTCRPKDVVLVNNTGRARGAHVDVAYASRAMFLATAARRAELVRLVAAPCRNIPATLHVAKLRQCRPFPRQERRWQRVEPAENVARTTLRLEYAHVFLDESGNAPPLQSPHASGGDAACRSQKEQLQMSQCW